MTLGVVLESLGMPFRPSVAEAARLGLSAVQLDATGEFAPERLGETARRDVRTLLRSHELAPAALNAPLRRGLDTAADLEPRLAYLRQVMQLAVDLGCPRIVAPLPALPADDADPRQATLHEALTALDRDADRLGLQVALEAGIDPGASVRNVLGRYERGRLAVTFDPANFLLNGHDPVAEAAALGDRIILVHARDARAERTSRGSGRETAPGAGDVDWLALTATLDAAGVHVPMLIERTEGTTRREDVASGAKFLRRFVTAAIRM